MPPTSRDFIDDDMRRVTALNRLHLLDGDPEPFFDDLIELVQQICHAPIALISLTDVDRQWFKVKRGLELDQLPRRGSLCEYVVNSRAPLAISDTVTDARFSDNSLVTGPAAIRAYIGAPILVEGGIAVGTVCALDIRPRTWGPHEIRHLERAGRMVASHAEARALHAELATRHMLLKEREASSQRLRAILEAMKEGVVVHAADGSVVMSNRAAGEILGLTTEQLHGRTSDDPQWKATDASGAPLTGSDHPAMRALASGEPQERTLMTITRSDGARRSLLVSAFPLNNNDGAFERQVLATFVDITEQIQQQQQLNASLLKAEQAGRAKAEFLAAMSHEIRTPLNGLLGVAQYLARKTSDPALTPSIELLRSSGLALKEIVDDALDIESVDAGMMPLHRSNFNPSKILGELIAVHEPMARDKGLALDLLSELPSDLQLLGDVGRLRQILHNLLSNAVKYTAAGNVSVHARAVRQSASGFTLHIEVHDTGRGISPDFVDTLFARFTRDSGGGAVNEGSGLGLYLASKYAKLMGGTLSYSANFPEGSRFELILPMDVGSASLSASEPDESADVSHIRVLIAEDHAVNKHIFTLLLEPFGMVATYVEDGLSALAEAKDGNFDLILMDRQMPGLDGIEVTRQLRRWERDNDRIATPVVFVSANGTDTAIAQAKSAGANGYVTKPIVAAVLAKEIVNAMKNGRAG